MKDTNGNPITEEEFMKDIGHGVVDMKNCIRVHPYGLNDPTPLCNYGSCSHVLLPSEKFCPCHTQSNNWEEEFKNSFLDTSGDWHKTYPEHIEYFITKLLAEQKKEYEKIIKKIHKNHQIELKKVTDACNRNADIIESLNHHD